MATLLDGGTWSPKLWSQDCCEDPRSHQPLTRGCYPLMSEGPSLGLSFLLQEEELDDRDSEKWRTVHTRGLTSAAYCLALGPC